MTTENHKRRGTMIKHPCVGWIHSSRGPGLWAYHRLGFLNKRLGGDLGIFKVPAGI